MIAEERKALSEVKILNGMPPICASCKKSAMTRVTGTGLRRISIAFGSQFQPRPVPGVHHEAVPEFPDASRLIFDSVVSTRPYCKLTIAGSRSKNRKGGHSFSAFSPGEMFYAQLDVTEFLDFKKKPAPKAALRTLAPFPHHHRCPTLWIRYVYEMPPVR